MRGFYHYIDSERDNPTIEKIFLNNPLETWGYAKSNKNYDHKRLNEIVHRDPRVWGKA
jgi:hypothetical protein